jgi:hypothetical protein
VHPRQTGELETVDTVVVAPQVQKLFEYIRDRGTLVAITTYNKCACHRFHLAHLLLTRRCINHWVYCLCSMSTALSGDLAGSC